MSARTTMVGRLSLVVIALLALAALAELGLRLRAASVERGLASSQPGAVRRIHDFFYFDRNGCFRIVPHAQGWHRSYEGAEPVLITINGEGFRGAELATGATRRIAFVGDSIVFDGGEQLADTFVQQIETRLNHAGGELPFECLNLGTTDAGIAQYIAKVRDHALSLHPQAIVIAFYLNDSRPPQGFLGEDGYAPAERRLRASPAYRLLTVQALHTLYRRVRFSRDETLSHRFRWAPRFQSRRWVSDATEWNQLLAEADFDWGAAWRDETWPGVADGLAALQRLCAAGDCRLLVACFPASPQVEAEVAYPNLAEPQRRLAEITARLGIPRLDLLPILQAHRSERLFFDQCHLTRQGNRVVADALAAWLPAQLAVTPAARPSTAAESRGADL